MNLNELKIGDRVKYKSTFGGLIKVGVIIGTFHNGFYIGKDIQPKNCEEQCYSERIISKLEPIIEGWHEIPIEKEEKPAPKSFKFDFNVCSVSMGTERGYSKSIMTGYGKHGGKTYKDLVLPYDYNLGDVTLDKTYTVEIKEKE